MLTNVHHHLQNSRTVFILVTPETLNRSPDLRVFAQAAGFPVAFIFDEAHMVPSWGIEFREELLRVAETIRFIPESQLILSSASISLPDIKFIERCYGEEIDTVFTQLFIRRNVKYTVLPVQTLPGGKASLQKFISSSDDIATFLNARFLHDSVIVFIENKKLVNMLAAGLNGVGFPVVRYHSDMTPNAKIVAMGSWLGDNPRFIIATSAISLGVDSERCVGTVHFGQASSIYNLIQETGRVGRRGQPSECITVTDASFTYNKLCSTIEFHQKRVDQIPVKTILAGNAELLAWAATTQRLMCIPAMLLQFVDPSIEPDPCGICTVRLTPAKGLQLPGLEVVLKRLLRKTTHLRDTRKGCMLSLAKFLSGPTSAFAERNFLEKYPERSIFKHYSVQVILQNIALLIAEGRIKPSVSLDDNTFEATNFHFVE